MIIMIVINMIIIISPVQGGSCQLVHLVSVRWSCVQQCVDQTWHIVTLCYTVICKFQDRTWNYY